MLSADLKLPTLPSMPTQRPFSYSLFQRVLQNNDSLDLPAYLSDPAVLERFRHPVQHFFYAKEPNISEVWKNAGIVSFSHENTPINKRLMDCIMHLTNDLNISVLKVFEYLDNLVKNSPEILRLLLQPEINPQHLLAIEENIMSQWHKDRMNLLRGIYGLIERSHDIGQPQFARVACDFLDKAMEDNSLLNSLIQSYQQGEDVTTSPFLRKNPEIYLRGRLKEEYVALKSIFSLFMQNWVKRDFPKFYGKLLTIFIRQKFEGSLSSIFENLKLSNHNVSRYALNLADKIGVLILFTLLAGLLNNLNFEENNEGINYSHLLGLNKEITDQLEPKEGIIPGPKVVFFQSVYIVILKACLVKDQNSSADQKLTKIDETVHKFDNGIVDNFGEHLHLFLNSIKELEETQRQFAREIFKILLKVLFSINQSDPEILNELFFTADAKNNSLLKIFKEVMKSNAILCNFWAQEFGQESILFQMTAEFLSGFPYDKVSFLRTVDAILGNKSCAFAEEILTYLMDLQRITIEMNPKLDPRFRESNRSKQKFPSEEADQRGTLLPFAEIDIPESAVVSAKPGYLNVYEVQLPFNFWEYMFKELTEFIVHNLNSRKPAFPEHIKKYIKLIAKIVLINPNSSSKIQELFLLSKGESIGVESKGQKEVPVLLYFLIFGLLKLSFERSEHAKLCSLLLKAVKSLFISEHGESVRCFFKLYPLIADSSISSTHFFVELFNSFKLAERDIDNFRYNETYFYSSLIEMLEIFKIVCLDEEVWAGNFLAGTLEAPGKERRVLGAQVEAKLRRLSELHVSFTEEGSWFERAEEVQVAFTEIQALDEFISSNAISELWEALILPLCERYLKDDFDITFKHTNLKYKLFTGLFEFVNCFLRKFDYTTSKMILKVQDSKENPKQRFDAQLARLRDTLPLREMVLDAFEVLVDGDRPGAGQTYRTKGLGLGITNKHWAATVLQRKGANSEAAVLEFLGATFETFSLLAGQSRQELCSEVAKGEPSALAKTFLHDFCYKESFFSYKAEPTGTGQSSNFVVALIAAMCVGQEAGQQKGILGFPDQEARLQPFTNLHWNNSLSLFPGQAEQNRFLFSIVPEMILSRIFSRPTGYEKARSIAEAGLKALEALLHFWQAQQQVKRPNLEDFVLGIYNDLPSSRAIFNRFALILNEAVKEGLSGAFDLLLRLQEGQHRFLEEYFNIGDTTETENKKAFIRLFSFALKQLNGMANVTQLTLSCLNARENFFKLCLFVIRLLRSKRIRKAQLDQLWLSLFDLMVEHLFKHIAEDKEPFVSCFEFLAEVLQRQERFEQQFGGLYLWAFNMLKFYHLAKFSNFADRTLSEMLELFAEGFLDKLGRRSSNLIDNHAQTFFKFFNASAQKLMEYVLSSNVIHGDILLSKLQQDNLVETVEIINQDLLGARRESLLYRQVLPTAFRSGSPIISFVQVSESNGLKTEEPQEIEGLKKLSFDPLSIFLVLCSIDVRTDKKTQLAYLASFYNQIEKITISKKNLQGKFSRFLQMSFSVGLEGNFAGLATVATPSPDFSRYLLSEASRLGQIGSDGLGVSFLLLQQQFTSSLSKGLELSSEIGHSSGENSIQPSEKSYLVPFAGKTGSLSFSVMNLLLRDPAPKVSEAMLGASVDTLVARLDYCADLAKFCSDCFLKENQRTSTFSSVSFEVFAKIFHLCNPHLLLAAHIVSNIFSAKSFDSKKIEKIFQRLVGQMSQAAPLVLHLYKSISVDIEAYLNCLLYLFYTLKLIRVASDPEQLGPIIELLNAVLLKPRAHGFCALNIFDCIYAFNWDLVQQKDINAFSERLTASDVDLKEFTAIIQMLSNLCTIKSNSGKIQSSNLLKNLLQIQVISLSKNFQQCVMYQNQLPDEAHSMFCHLLNFVTLLLQKFSGTASVLQFSLSFLTKYQRRFEMILGLGSSTSSSEFFDGNEMTLQFKNLEFMEELSLVLAFFAIVAQESDFWASKNRRQFNSFIFLLSTRTLRIFSHELFNESLSANRFSQFLAISNRFGPVTRFESHLQGVGLKSTATAIPVRPLASALKSSIDPKSSLHNELNRFKDFKNVFLTHASQSSDLFAFRLENLVNEAAFNVGAALAAMFEVADFEEIYMDPSNALFDQNFFKAASHNLIDLQLLLLYAYQKLSIAPETYKDGCVHLQALITSFEARLQSLGMSSLAVNYSLLEMKNLVRKAFEMSFYVQSLVFQVFDRIEIRNKHFFIDELKKHQEKSRMLLQDFESYLVRRENISSSLHPKDSLKYQSPIKSPYKSVAKFTPKNIALLELNNIDEDVAKQLLVNSKSLETHIKFLEFIRNYYNVK